MNLKYEAAVIRNLAELQKARLIKTTINGFSDYGPVSNIFLKITQDALYDDYLVRCCRVFERSVRVASFWYVYDCNKSAHKYTIKNKSIDVELMREASEKLRHIRNRNLLHIDRDTVIEPKGVWDEADLKVYDLAQCVDWAWYMLEDLQKGLNVSRTTLPVSYTREVVRKIVMTVEESTN